MHSFLTWKNQPYHDADYPIFVAEVASTFHEELLFRALLRETTDPKRRAFLINQKLDDIRSTFFRQAMFAEFELEMHAAVEQGIPLTPTFLKEKYRALNAAYFGPDVVLDDEISIEWARIPHFYYNYYVYQYATGIAAAYALVESVEGQGPEKYLQFLASGGSAYPLDLLQRAGVDMRASAPLEALIRRFDELTEELKKILP
jgi:oligoendopeptidase F